jgi:hypothetical protein
MDKEENDRKDKEKVNERGCHMEDDECPNPREEQKKCEGKKYKPHEQTPLWPAIISLFSAGSSVCPYPREAPGPHSENRTWRSEGQFA